MELDFQTYYKELETYEDVYARLINKTFKHLSLSFDPIISVSLVNNDFIHTLNRDYRNIDKPTDVISFAFLDGEVNKESLMHSTQTVCLGDIYISIDKAKEQAIEYGHSLDRELRFLFIHGLLHLLGYDHMNEEDEKIMFHLQDELLAIKE